ncbi:MAG: EVE domain-containing protein [Planctomycetes bacterium]|nr:EVE domain-containing protein [Planctomycetota bacterium]
MARRYWLLKSEPTVFSIQDLAKAKGQTTCWEGVRNYQARNLLRDELQAGDGVIFHHSNAKPPHIAGTAVVARAGYPDAYAWKKGHKYFDPKTDKSDPTWFMVDVKLERIFDTPLSLDFLKTVPALTNMMLLQRGSRLSVQPVTPKEWKAVLRLADKTS